MQKYNSDSIKKLWTTKKNIPNFTYHKPNFKEPEITIFDQIHFLEGLLQVGVDKAKKLLHLFSSPIKIIRAILATEIIFSPSGKTRRLKGPFEKIKGFGPKFIEENQQLLTSNYI